MKTLAVNRRTFLKQSLAATATLSALGTPRVLGANERVVIGVMGLGGRGTYLAEAFAKRPDVSVSYVCDADTRRFARAREAVEKAQNRPTAPVQDFRKMLEDRSVDAIVNATPDHWHALGSILACQAGKDVYVEKPMAYNLWEGRKMIEAARKYQRVVTVGMQSRSAPYVKSAVEYVRSGKLGDIHLVRVFNLMQHPLVKPGLNQPPPAELDYDLWCGPAAQLPYNPGRPWLNQSEYSCGPIPGDAVHQLDLARLLMGDLPCPASVSAISAVSALKDGRDTPDTQLALFEYSPFTLALESALWTPYMKKTPMEIRDTDQMPNWPFNATRIEFLGTRGFMYMGRHGDGWQVFNENSELIATTPGRQGDREHQDNFIQCIRSRAKPAADVEQGHYSAMLCHLANIAWRTGNTKLVFDARTESFPATPEANRFLKRAVYREPWVIPDPV
jgi:predicted dehydrogenase